jgi:hypothetical protein
VLRLDPVVAVDRAEQEKSTIGKRKVKKASSRLRQ